MTDLRLPCAEGNPDDWFIGRDGKQYPDEELVGQHERDGITDSVAIPLMDPEWPEAVDRAIDRAEAEIRTASLRRRRHAKEACHESCLFRTRCLGRALEEGHQHGTWGGYYEEEIREIRVEIERRKGVNDS